MKPTKKQSQKQPKTLVIPKSQASAIFAKLVKNATTYDNAWSMVRKAFPRQRYGKVRQVAQLAGYKTFAAAYAAAHQKGSSKKAKHAA
jgi:hypothetical protein